MDILKGLHVFKETKSIFVSIQKFLVHLNDNYAMEVKMLEHRMQLLKEANKELTIEEVRTELNLRFE